MSKIQLFPQIIRIFSAILLWSAMVFVVSVNAINVSINPVNVLGATQTEKETVLEEYAFWQKIVREKPEYRDAYIALTSLAYQLSKPEEAKAYLTQAATLDPNSEVIKKLFFLFGR